MGKKDSTEIATVESSQIATFLRQKNFEIIENADVVIDFHIEKTLIEGTVDEYSNKIFLKDTLQTKQAVELLQFLKNDVSYNWEAAEEPTNFEPNRQFLIRSSSGRLVLLLDEEENMLGFINLDGQKVLKLSTEFSRYLNDL